MTALADAGIRVVSLANNPIMDFGAEGPAETLATLDAAGISSCGAGPDQRAACAPVSVKAGGLRVSFSSAMQRYRLYEAESLYAAHDRPGPCRPHRLTATPPTSRTSPACWRTAREARTRSDAGSLSPEKYSARS